MKRRERRIRQGRGLGGGGTNRDPGACPGPSIVPCPCKQDPAFLGFRMEIVRQESPDLFFCLFVSLFFFFFSFILIIWRLITLQYCSGFCHTLT